VLVADVSDEEEVKDMVAGVVAAGSDARYFKH